MARETIRYDADRIWIRCGCNATRCDIQCTIRIRYGYDATRYDALVRDNDGSLPPDRFREPIKSVIVFTYHIFIFPPILI